MYLLLEAALAALLLLPPVALLCKKWRMPPARRLLLFLFALYLAGMYLVVGLPNVTYVRLDANINLVPFRGMLDGLTGTILNVILFLPLGFFLPLLWKPFCRIRPSLLTGLGMSLAIELLQLLTFRATDVNDLITNTAGTLLGWWAGRLAVRWFPPLHGTDDHKELSGIMGSVFCVMFFLHPVFLNLLRAWL